jgi:hypothetical protein
MNMNEIEDGYEDRTEGFYGNDDGFGFLPEDPMQRSGV